MSKLGRTPNTQMQTPPSTIFPEQQGRAAFFGLDLTNTIIYFVVKFSFFFFLFSFFESEPAPVKKVPEERLFFEPLDCPYEEHCEYDHW